MTADEAERLGRIAYEACCAGDRPRGFDVPDPWTPWEGLPPEAQAHFAREAAAVAAEVRRQDRAKLERRRDAYWTQYDANPNAYWADLANAFEEAIAILSGEQDA